MSFGVELIGFSLALGTDDIVTGDRSIVVPMGQFVRVSHRERVIGETSRICTVLALGDYRPPRWLNE